MFELTLMFDNVSRYRSQLPAQVTRHEVEVDCKEREIEFGDYIGNIVYGFYSWYASHIFHYN